MSSRKPTGTGKPPADNKGKAQEKVVRIVRAPSTSAPPSQVVGINAPKPTNQEPRSISFAGLYSKQPSRPTKVVTNAVLHLAFLKSADKDLRDFLFCYGGNGPMKEALELVKRAQVSLRAKLKKLESKQLTKSEGDK